MGNPESLKMPRVPCIFHDFFNGEGSVRNPESLKIMTFSFIFRDFLNGERSVGNPESLKMPRYPYIFMISLMEKETWETQNH